MTAATELKVQAVGKACLGDVCDMIISKKIWLSPAMREGKENTAEGNLPSRVCPLVG